VFCGATYSYTHGGSDFIVYKVDAAGQKLWRKNFGGQNDDEAISIDHAEDGGFVVCGWSNSYYSEYSFLAYGLDAAGQKEWRITPAIGYGLSVKYSGYRVITAGYTNNLGTNNDFRVKVYLPAEERVFGKTLGGSESDVGYCIR
jgi:hypothetical protein